MSYSIVNFYRFVPIDDANELKPRLFTKAKSLGLIGTILLAAEGINCSLGGSKEALAEFHSFLDEDPRFRDLDFKYSDGSRRPFRTLIVKVKSWIIRFAEDVPLSNVEIKQGKRLTPTEFKQILEQPSDDVVIVDTRNWYETDFGKFEQAKTLPLRTFTNFPEEFQKRYSDQKDKKFIFYCTGGIRCEKVVPWAEKQGFKNSYQLEGGILNYFKDHGSQGFEGKCFVFDHRWLVDGDLRESDDDSMALRIQPKPLDPQYV